MLLDLRENHIDFAISVLDMTISMIEHVILCLTRQLLTAYRLRKGGATEKQKAPAHCNAPGNRRTLWEQRPFVVIVCVRLVFLFDF